MDRVLIVDDDTQLLLIIKEALEEYSGRFELVTAKDGLEAIKALQKHAFAVVVTDIQMPNVNGLVLLAYMSRNFPNTPCIIVTGHPSPFLKRQMQERAAYYFEKPFKISELAQAIVSVVGEPEVLRGTLNGVSLSSFVKMVEMEYLSCVCEVTSPNSEKGYLVFDKGDLINAFYGRLRGEKAAIGLLADGGIKIRFRKVPKKKFTRRINKKLSTLLIEAKIVKHSGVYSTKNWRLDEREEPAKTGGMVEKGN